MINLLNCIKHLFLLFWYLSTKSSGEQVSLDVSALSEGNYILQISDGVEISVEQIIIKR